MTPSPSPTCDAGRHVWLDPFVDGDTCLCGRFYLELHPVDGERAVLLDTPPLEDDDGDAAHG